MLETGVAIPQCACPPTPLAAATRRYASGRGDYDCVIRLARDLGFVLFSWRVYDVYYEEHDEGTRQRFAEGLAWR